MKQILISLLLMPSLILATNKIDQLEEEIGKCNVENVKILLDGYAFYPADQQRLLDFANDVIAQRGSFVTLLIPMRENLLIVAGGLAGGGISVTLVDGGWVDSSLIKNVLMAAGIIGFAAIPISFIKHFCDYGKLWNNAIRIKYLINNADIVKTNGC